MTALSTGLALLPVALGFGEPGSAIQAPLALVIICGLLSSTVLNMFVVPSLYWRSLRQSGTPGATAESHVTGGLQ